MHPHGNALGDALREDEIAEIARLAGPRNESGVGYTWSDLSESVATAQRDRA